MKRFSVRLAAIVLAVATTCAHAVLTRSDDLALIRIASPLAIRW
jgi:hypothetical protein